jgi:hypothetical protein
MTRLDITWRILSSSSDTLFKCKSVNTELIRVRLRVNSAKISFILTLQNGIFLGYSTFGAK